MNSKFALLSLLALSASAFADAPKTSVTEDMMIGKMVPKIELASSKGGMTKLPTGHWTVLYFYPKDDTPGCTTEACSFRDSLERFTSLGIDVFGVSSDDLKSHEAFVGKHKLNFPLLSDPKHALAEPLGVKGMVYLSRDTFLIDPSGKIVEVWRGVKPGETVSQTLDTIKKYVVPTPKAEAKKKS